MRLKETIFKYYKYFIKTQGNFLYIFTFDAVRSKVIIYLFKTSAIYQFITPNMKNQVGI